MIIEEIFRHMDILRVLPAIALAMAARGVFADRVVTLPSLSEAGLPNSEVTTNIALNINWERLEMLTFSIGVDACESNFVSVAVGTASGDTLALEEADFEWGCDCGVWFSANTETGEVERESVPVSGWAERVISIGKRQVNASWNMVRLTKRGAGSFETEFSQGEENKTFRLILR